MDNLRLILLGIGLLIIATIYLYGTYGDRLREHRHRAKLGRKALVCDLEKANATMLAELDAIGIGGGDSALENRNTAKVVSLLIKAPTDKYFTGENIKQAAEAAGLEFGKMDIFHHYGSPNKLEQPLFSLANMYEPGSFDLHQTTAYKGLILFMHLSPSVDNLAAFDLMQETATKLADSLQGELWYSRKRLMDEQLRQDIRARIR